MTTTKVEFNATGLNRTADANKRFLIAVYGFVLVVAVASAFGLAARDWHRVVAGGYDVTTYPFNYDIFGWIMCTILALLEIYGLSYLRKGASVVRVTGVGIELEFPGGRTLRRGWHETTPPVSLHEWPGLPSLGYAIRVGRIDTRLPREAYDFILQKARELGLPTYVGTAFALYAAAKPRITWIRPSAVGIPTPPIGGHSS